MSDQNPNFHQRWSIRLKDTIIRRQDSILLRYACKIVNVYSMEYVRLSGHPCLDAPIYPKFRVPQKEMILNDAGEMIVKWYYELESKYPNIRFHEMVVMPNHFHCIVEMAGEYGYDPFERYWIG